MALVEGTLPDLRVLESHLTLRNKYTEKPLVLFRRVPQGLLIPRMFPVREGGVRAAFPSWDDPQIKSNVVLRDYQQVILDTYLERLGDSYGGIIKATTGSGKTVMGVDLIAKIKGPSLVIVPTDLIMKQWIDQVKTLSNQKNVGIIRQSTADIQPVTVAMIHTLSKERHRYLENAFRHVIYDEVHTLGADTFSRTAGMFNCAIRTGLSATPRRKDGMGKAFEWHIGPVLVTYDKANVIPKVVILDYYNTATRHSGCVWGGNLNLGRYYNKIVRVTSRNELILRMIRQAYGKGHNILVLSDRIEQLEWFKSRLQAEAHDVGMVTGTIKQLDKVIKLATYGSAGMGMDIPKLTCVIFATPRSDVEQAVGRVLRTADKQQPLIVDIFDTASGIMAGWGQSRIRLYNKIGAGIKRVSVEA